MRTSWDDPVCDLLRLAGAGLHFLQAEAAHFAKEPHSSQPPPEAILRSPTGEGDRRSNSLPATQRHTGKNSGGDLILLGGEWASEPAPHTLYGGCMKVILTQVAPGEKKCLKEPKITTPGASPSPVPANVSCRCAFLPVLSCPHLTYRHSAGH